MLLGWQYLSISRPEVRVAQALLVPLGDAAPQHAAGRFATVADGVGHDLTGTPALGQPHPALVLAAAYERPHLIEFKNIALLGLCQRCLQGRQVRGFF